MANSLHTFKLAVWNADGIHNKKLELLNFLTENSIDIMCVSETHLNRNKSFNLPNYHIYRADRLAQRGGGAAVIAKINIQSHLVNIDNASIYEAVTIKAKLPKHGQLLITAIYHPPQAILEEMDEKNL